MKKDMSTLFFIVGITVAAITFIAPATAADKFNIEVYAGNFDSIPIGIVNFKPTNPQHVIRENFPWDIIANDLDFNGKFGVVKRADFDSAFFAAKGIALYIDGQYTIEDKSIVIECYLKDVTSRSVLLTKKYRGEVKFMRNMVHRYTNELVETLFGDKGIFESRILYVKADGQKKNIAIMDFDGYGRAMLTNNTTINIFPTFIDKSTVLWSSYLRGKPDIYKGSITEGTSKIFLQGEGLLVSPDVSPIDGTIAYASSKTGSLNVYVCAPDGSKQRQLTFGRGISTAPSWSPNGYQIAFTTDRGGGPQIYIMDATGSNQRRVTMEGRYNDLPAWSPKGNKIAYASLGENYQYNIWTVSPDGSDAKMVASLPGISENPTWSPDGNLIAFVNTNGAKSDMYVIRADGTRLRKVTNTGDIRMPKWSNFFK